MGPRVVVCETVAVEDEPAVAALAADGFEVQRCANTADLVESVARQRPAAVIVHLLAAASELPMLRLLRRIAPEMPMVLVSDGSSLGAQRALLALGPSYHALTPLEPGELVAAVRGALARKKARDLTTN